MTDETPDIPEQPTNQPPATPAESSIDAAEVAPTPSAAQTTAEMGAPSEIICFTCDTSTVIPRSLNEPLWVLPQSLIQSSFTPIIFPKRSAQKRLVPPS